ncbi:MAG: hypothetical protein EA382_17690 [Spirochaetaceae bacterium]|nr:MAG: hypothetical protein EA382_17690 [Spirochaetaceae bacterium]
MYPGDPTMATFRIRSVDERLNHELKKERRRPLSLTKRFEVSRKSIASFGAIGAANDLWIAAAAPARSP